MRKNKYIQGEEEEKTEEPKTMGIIITITETKKKHFDEQKQVYVNDERDECKFVCLESNVVCLIEKKILF